MPFHFILDDQADYDDEESDCDQSEEENEDKTCGGAEDGVATEQLFEELCNDRLEQELLQNIESVPSYKVNDGESLQKSHSETLSDIMYNRIVNRFLNMEQKNFKKKVLRSISKKKNKALRERLNNGSSTNSNQSSNLMTFEKIAADTSPDKGMSFSNLKFNVMRDRSVLNKGFTRKELHLLFIASDVNFFQGNKQALIERFAQEVSKQHKFEFSQVLTTANLKLLDEKGGLRIILQSRMADARMDVVQPDTPTATPANAVSATANQTLNNDGATNYNDIRPHPQAPARRAKFTPTEEDKNLLLSDIANGKTDIAQARRRAAQFNSKGYNVHFTQVQRWYKSKRN